MSAKDFLLSIDSKKIKYGLSRTKELLRACGNPEKKLYAVQVVGTNGKGSTAAMLANVLINNNYNTGLFTSPHLVEINERIRINHKNIPDDFIEYFLLQYKQTIATIEPSFFEIMTVLSLCYFVHKAVDIAILETGLGGRLDSVTAAQSQVIVFTPIDYDHMSILGNTLIEIAKEKAGVINNKNQILISSKQRQIVKKTLNNTANKKNNRIIYSDTQNIKFPLLSTQHQLQNANLANMAMEHIQSKYKLSCHNMVTHIQNTIWPGRIQKIQKSPDIIFDVAHNSHSLRAFINYLHTHRKFYKKAFLIIGFEDGKDVKKELPDLYQHFDQIDCTETKIRHSMPADYLFNLYQPVDKAIAINYNPLKIIQIRSKNLSSQDLLVILGSHYFGPHLNAIYKNCFDIKCKK
tara:strand:+ start:251 stop:1468 length:1218 start_codon:yes stop_codon:yes gene_type:complete